MKSTASMIFAAFVLLCSVGTAQAVSLYVDSAPNAYGSPDYAGWWSDAKQRVTSGTFVNMQHSSNPANVGTQNFEIDDAVVYSFGDLGKRLHFVYWIPNESVDSLITKEFGIRMEYVWDGVTTDFYNEYYGSSWLQPTKWENYNGGVIGTAGFAWWGAFGVDTQEALDQELAEWDRHQGNIIIGARVDGETTSLTAHHTPVPEPATIILLAAGLGGLALIRRKRQS